MYDYYIYETVGKDLMLYRHNKENDKIEYMINPAKNLGENCFFGSFIELLICKNSEVHEWYISITGIKTVLSGDKFTYIGNLND